MLTKALLGVILLLAVAAGALGFIAYERGLKLDTAAETHKADRQTITSLSSADTDNQTTIADLHQRLDAAAGQLADVQEAQAQAQAQADRATKARDATLIQLQDARNRLYATDHDAATWGAGTMPASLSTGLRHEWNAAAGHP